MENKLQKENSLAQKEFPLSTINNFSRVDKYINQANKVTNLTFNCFSNLTNDETLQEGCLLRNINNKYYNLIVLDKHGVLSNNKFTIRASQVLLHTKESIRRVLLSFNEKAKNKIKSYPTLICKSSEPWVEYGYITNLELKEGFLDFCLLRLPVANLLKSDLLKVHHELSIGWASDINELQLAHWSVKEVDIVKSLKNHGYEIPIISI